MGREYHPLSLEGEGQGEGDEGDPHMTTPPDLLSNLRAVTPHLHARRLGLVLDFDGTISEIAPTPEQAHVLPEAARALRGLANKLPLSAVMSGRAVSDVAALVGVDGLAYLGNHGAELLHDGQLELAPEAQAARDAVFGVFEELRSAVDLPGLVWQDKRLSATVHFRLAADPDSAARQLDDALRRAGPATRGVEAFWGKMALELRPVNGPDKGSAARSLARRFDLDGLLFVGDDTTDVDAMRAVSEMSSEGQLSGLSVVVLHHDTPEPALRAADYSLGGVPEMGRFLSWLERAVTPIKS